MKHKPKIAFILNSFPVLSETFVFKEVMGLRNRGLHLQVFSLFAPKGQVTSNADDLDRDTVYFIPSLNLVSFIWAHLFFAVGSSSRYFSALYFAINNRESAHSLFTTLLKIKTYGK